MKVCVYSAQAAETEFYKHAAGSENLSFNFVSAPLSKDNITSCFGFEGIVITTNCRIDEETAAALEKQGVRYIACRSAGSDHVDYAAIKKHGMHCCCVPFYSPEAIAEYAILMALKVLRCDKKLNLKLCDGDYSLPGLRGRQLDELTAGVIGTGRIGRTTIKLLSGFGTNVLGWDPYPNDAAAQLCTYVGMDELYSQSDIIFLHCPLTDENYHLINAGVIDKMKDGAVIINPARGGLVDHSAVLDALNSGKLGGFAFDVYENEKPFVRKQKTMAEINDQIFEQLLSRDDVIYSPHIAFYTDKAIQNMIEMTIQNLCEYDATGECRNELH